MLQTLDDGRQNPPRWALPRREGGYSRYCRHRPSTRTLSRDVGWFSSTGYTQHKQGCSLAAQSTVMVAAICGPPTRLAAHRDTASVVLYLVPGMYYSYMDVLAREKLTSLGSRPGANFTPPPSNCNSGQTRLSVRSQYQRVNPPPLPML